jgi:hypothetical protein
MPVRGGDTFWRPHVRHLHRREAQTIDAWASGTQPSPKSNVADASHEDDDGALPVASPALADTLLTTARQHPGFGAFPWSATHAPDDRELFFMLVNIENYPGVLPLAHARVGAELQRAIRLMETADDPTRFRYTDPRYFDYSPDAFEARFEAIYHDKLVAPIAPLNDIADEEDVVFQQKTFALGNLIDGAWAYRTGLRGARHLRKADTALFEIYADEMGRGEVKKNHIQLIYQVLRSMHVELPHIASRAFVDQDELIDELYPFALYQLSLAQFPDTYRAEILGFNLGIEMFGLGELRLHEIQKLRHWGFDPAYEITHLSIDNFASGHARTSIDAIATHLDDVLQALGVHARDHEWRRIWSGYASFAQFIEQDADAVTIADSTCAQ